MKIELSKDAVLIIYNWVKAETEFDQKFKTGNEVTKKAYSEIIGEIEKCLKNDIK